MSHDFNWPLQRIAAAAQGSLLGTAATISGISTDTRTIKPGDLFIALRGPNFDAHDFAADAVALGAAAVMVERQLAVPVPQVIVPDTRLALGHLAGARRAQFNIPVIAITGSNGKTTVKEMIAAICAQRGAVLATQGNLNNDIGVPLTLLRINSSHKFAVVEMGANHPGEIAYLTHLTRPDVALINNAGPAHLEGFGSLQGVAQAKGEIYGGLSSQGVGIVNADDNFAGLWRGLCRNHAVLSFGLSNTADVSARWVTDALGSHVTIITGQGEVEVTLRLLGRHNIMNALAASAAALACGCSLQDIKQGLESLQPVKGRLQLKHGKNGSKIIDDTYNANPASFKAALDVLSIYPGQRYVALGDMGELGEGAAQMHREIGAYAKSSGIDRLYTVGQFAQFAAEGFGPRAKEYRDQPGIIGALLSDLTAEVTLLVKGSRSMHMEDVVNALTQSEV